MSKPLKFSAGNPCWNNDLIFMPKRIKWVVYLVKNSEKIYLDKSNLFTKPLGSYIGFTSAEKQEKGAILRARGTPHPRFDVKILLSENTKNDQKCCFLRFYVWHKQTLGKTAVGKVLKFLVVEKIQRRLILSIRGSMVQIQIFSEVIYFLRSKLK